MGRHDEIKLGLENMEKLCAELKQPQNDVKTIHIAGTNGKGSTGSFIYSVLRECGYKVGRYTSPAVFDSREKFQINDRYISDEEIQKYRKIVLKAAENTECVPTVFEVETTMAFCFFSVNKCDYSLIECGMGGRLDATNVCGNVAAAVITSISLDHTDFLGDTTEKIAEEKSGIIKNGARVVVFKQGENIMKIIKEKCRKENCEMIYADKENIINTKYENDAQSFEYKGMKIETSLLGAHQRENCITAVECCRALGIDDEKIIKGIKNAKWNGRFETIRENPRIIIDGAHNEDAVNRLKENVDIYYKGKKIIYITGVFKDKDYENMARICTFAEMIFTVKPNGERGLSAEKYAECIKKYNKNVYAEKSIKDALIKSIGMADENSVIICFGSLSILAQLKEYVEGI